MMTLDLLSQAKRNVRLAAAPQKKLEDLLVKALNVVVVGLPLAEAQAFGSSRSDLERHIKTMPLADLKKLLKLWDPVRKLPKEVTITEMRELATDLLAQRRQPQIKIAPARKSKKAA